MMIVCWENAQWMKVDVAVSLEFCENRLYVLSLEKIYRNIDRRQTESRRVLFLKRTEIIPHGNITSVAFNIKAKSPIEFLQGQVSNCTEQPRDVPRHKTRHKTLLSDACIQRLKCHCSCTEACVDKDRNCGANPGWPKSWCTDKNVFGGMMYDTVNAKCPKMCGHCGLLLLCSSISFVFSRPQQ